MYQSKLNLSYASAFFLVVLATAIHAYWPTYLSVIFNSNVYSHFHAFIAAIWIALLIVQPYLIKNKRYAIHRIIGRFSVILAPILVLSIFLFAYHKLQEANGNIEQWRFYLFYLQSALAILFAMIYCLGLFFRKQRAIHSRFMVATGLTMLDPIFARSLYWLGLQVNFQYITIGITLAGLLILSIIDFKDQKVRWVFPSLFVLVFVMHIPILFGLTDMPWWQNITFWFASL